MVTDAEYLVWLQTPGELRVVLVEADCLDAGNPQKLLMSNLPYTPHPENVAYDDVLEGELSVSRRMSEVFSGRSSASRGDLEAFNDGLLDEWLEYWFGQQPLRVFLGAPGWSRDQFRLIIDGISVSPSAGKDSLTLSFRDKAELVDKPFPRGEINGVKKPLCFGDCFNVEPLLVDDAAHRYQVHDGPVESIAVRDSGVLLSGASAPVVDLATGTFELSTQPAGRITCDVQGAKPVTWLSTVVDIVRHILEVYADIGIDEINDGELVALNGVAPYVAGLYVNDDTTMSAALDQLMSSLGAYWFFDRLGVFRSGRLEELTGTAAHFIVEDDIDEDGVSVKRTIDPLKSIKLGYRKNWSVQSDGLAGSVSDAGRDLYGKPYTLAVFSAALPAYPGAQDGAENETLLVSQADAEAEAERRQALFSVPRKIYEVEAASAAFAINLADEVSVSFPGFVFHSGANGIVTALTDYPLSDSCVLEVWR